MEIRRLSTQDEGLARELFGLMATVFEEDTEPLSDSYVGQLLGSTAFWAVAAIESGRVVGGLTAHVLPMTIAPRAELFIYDLAVATAFQRRGVGRALLRHLRQEARAVGIDEIFVPADNDDQHALDFYHALGGEASPVTFFSL